MGKQKPEVHLDSRPRKKHPPRNPNWRLKVELLTERRPEPFLRAVIYKRTERMKSKRDYWVVWWVAEAPLSRKRVLQAKLRREFPDAPRWPRSKT